MEQEAKSHARNWQSPQRSTVVFLRVVGRQRVMKQVALHCIFVMMAPALSTQAWAIQFVAYFPLSADAKTTPIPSSLSSIPGSVSCLPLELSQAWQSYSRAWELHYHNPADNDIRLKLGLPLDGTAGKPTTVSQTSSRLAAAAMRLPIADMRRYESEHFILLSDAAEDRVRSTVSILEQHYCVWTQLFFPLWKDRNRWDHTKATNRQSTAKHRVVLFKNSQRYQQTLRSEGAAVLQSTGFYSDLKRIAFFHDQRSEDDATLAHELTHQLLSEATAANLRVRPGDRRDFWLVEGIACYMESVKLHQDHATIGGWQSSRLSFARNRVLSFGDDTSLQEIQNEGRAIVQRRSDLIHWYSLSAALTHQWIDETNTENPSGLVNLLAHLAKVYDIRNGSLETCEQAFNPGAIAGYLNLTDSDLTPVPPDSLRDLCLSRTQVTASGLKNVPPQSTLRWLDLAYLPLGNDDITRLCPTPASLTQLSLEATQIDDQLATWFADATRLRELDLSSTLACDAILMSLPQSLPLETLWLTGSKVTDGSVDAIIAMRSLKRVDLQLTGVSDAGLERLRAARPDLSVNPLTIESP